MVAHVVVVEAGVLRVPAAFARDRHAGVEYAVAGRDQHFALK